MVFMFTQHKHLEESKIIFNSSLVMLTEKQGGSHERPTGTTPTYLADGSDAHFHIDIVGGDRPANEKSVVSWKYRHPDGRPWRNFRDTVRQNYHKLLGHMNRWKGCLRRANSQVRVWAPSCMNYATRCQYWAATGAILLACFSWPLVSCCGTILKCLRSKSSSLGESIPFYWARVSSDPKMFPGLHSRTLLWAIQYCKNHQHGRLLHVEQKVAGDHCWLGVHDYVPSWVVLVQNTITVNRYLSTINHLDTCYGLLIQGGVANTSLHCTS